MESWKTMLQLTPRSIRLLVTDHERNEVLKAALPLFPRHPRALLTCLEGLALWSGEAVSAAICVGRRVDPGCAEALFGDGLLPLDSALVRFDCLSPVGRRRTIPGIGDFRQLRLLNARRA
jgi:hypothetical protein